MTDNSTFPQRILPRGRKLIQHWTNLSMRIKLTAIFLLVALLSVGTIAILNIRSTSAALTERTGKNLVSLANSTGHDLGATLVDHVTSMQSYALDPELQASVQAQNANYSGNSEAILAQLTQLDEQWQAAGDEDPLIKERLNNQAAAEFQEVQFLIPGFAEVFVTDRYGGLVAASDRTSDYYQADEEWWQAAYADGRGAVFVGRPARDESTGVIGVDLAVPVYARNNEVVGVMRTTLDVTALLDRLGHITLGGTGGADILVGTEIIESVQDLAGSGQAESAEHEGLDAAALAKINATSEDYIHAEFEGEPALIGHALVTSLGGEEYISDLGWQVIVHQAESEALAAVGAQTRSTGLLALLVAVITAVIGVGMGQFLAGPISRLTETVSQFTAGNLDARVEVKSEDEVGKLATNFNQMAEQVGGLLENVQARSEELEERTRELEASQRVTFAASERTTPDDLLGLVVNLIRDQFDLYHVQVYIVDEEREAAVLRESTGYAGRQLLQKKHHIPLDRPALVTRAIHAGEPVLVADVNEAEDWLPNPLLPDTQSELVVPLKIGDRVIGALDAQDRAAGRFTESTVALFQTMTDQVAFLFENSELVERTVEQTEALTLFTNQLRTAAEIARRLGTILDPEKLLQQVVEMMQSRFGLYHAHIYVLDEDTGQLTVRAGSGEVGRVLKERGHSIPLDNEKSLVARAARSQKPVVVDDVSLVSDFMPNPLLPQTRSEMAVPLVVGDRVLGVLDVQDDRPNRFSETELDTFSTLVGQIATALENARLYEETEQERDFSNTIINSLPGVFYVYDAQGQLVRWNRNFSEASGYADEEMATMLATDFIAQADKTLIADRMQEVFVSGESTAEAKLLTKDGHEIPYYFTGLRTSVGGETYLVGSGVDISERIEAERAIRESERQYRELLGSLRDGFAVVNLEGKVTDCNTAFEEISGYTLEELKEMTFSDLTPEKWHAMEAQILEEQVMVRGYSDLYQKEYIHKDGSIFPVELAVYLVRDEGGNPAGFWGFIRDITERKEAEQAIRESEERFRTLFEDTSDAILLIHKGRFVDCNKAAIDMLRMDSKEQLLNTKPSDLSPERQPDGRLSDEKANEQIQTAIQNGTHRFEWIHVRSDGEEFPVEVVLTALKQGEQQIVHTVWRDITERKRAEVTIRENEERLDLAMEAANAGVWEFWPQDDEAFFNDRWFAMLGYGPDELEHSYATWRSLLHPDDLERAEGAVFPAVEKGSDFVIEFRMQTKDGGWRWIHDIGKTVEWTEDGAAYRMIGTHTDVTEEKLAQQERERFTQQLRTASDLAEQINAILDPDRLLPEVVGELHQRFDLYHVHIYLLDEPAHDILVNADPDEVARLMRERELIMRAGSGQVGEKLLEQGHSIPLTREQSLVARAARERKVIAVDDTRTAPDFMPNPLLPDTKSEVAVPLVAGDKVLGVLDVQDSQPGRFTESDLDVFSTLAGQIATALQNADLFEQTQVRLRVSQALANAQTEDEVLDALIQQSDLYPNTCVEIALIDYTGQEPTAVVKRAKSFDSEVSSTGVGTRFPITDKPLYETNSPNTPFVTGNVADDPRVAPPARKNAQQVGAVSLTVVPIISGGQWLGNIMASSEIPNHFDRNTLYLYQALADQGATALRLARLFDETQQTAERLREVDRLKSEFMSSMSHELRTPLNSIIGFAEVLLMGISGELPPDIEEDIQAIYDNGQHLLRIINDILDLAKIEAGTMTLNMEPIEIAPLLEEIKTNNAGLLINKPIEMLVEAESELPVIEGDPVRLNQVLNNLVSNAVKFTEEGSITLRAFKDDGYVCLEVQDTGPGIKQENLKKIFERFRQADGSSARRAEGTGLGLAITRHLVQMHQGNIKVASEVDQGSTFSVRLPIQPSTPAASDGSAGASDGKQ